MPTATPESHSIHPDRSLLRATRALRAWLPRPLWILVAASVALTVFIPGTRWTTWIAPGASLVALAATAALLSRPRVRDLELLLEGQNVLFIGVNERTLAVYESFRRMGRLERVVGFIDESARSRLDIPYLGAFDRIRPALTRSAIDSVVIGLPLRSHYDTIHHVLRICESQGVTMHCLLDVFPTVRCGTALGVSPHCTTLVMYSAPIYGLQLRVKHAFDKIAAALLLLLVAPILLVAAACIKLTDRGPIFFTQERVGYNKRAFKMYKLRTMVRDAEARLAALEARNERDGAAFKLARDPRVTRVGRVLRKYSIDELPQLLNVLIGDMSLVGPRPLSMRDYERLPADWQRRRFSMRPGLTCYWQVNGRHTTTFERWMELDLEYIDRWNLLEDLKTLLKTIPEVLRGGGI